MFSAELGREVKKETMDSGEYNKKGKTLFSSFKTDKTTNSAWPNYLNSLFFYDPSVRWHEKDVPWAPKTLYLT